MNSKKILLVLLIVLFNLGVIAREKTKILLIGSKPDHAPQTHTYLPTLQVLAQCLNQNKGIKATISDGWPADSTILQDVKAIVLYSSPGGDILLKGRNREQFRRLINKGVGFAAIHWSTGAAVEIGEEYKKILGGWFNFEFSTLKIDSLLLKQINQAHPVCYGWKEYYLKDEIYINLKFDKNIDTILLVNVNNKEQVVAWSYQRTDNYGRSFGTTLGHFAINFSIEPFRKAVLNGILWTTNARIPKKGARSKIKQKDIDLMMGE